MPQMTVVMTVDAKDFTVEEIKNGFAALYDMSKDKPDPRFKHRELPVLESVEVHENINRMVVGRTLDAQS